MYNPCHFNASINAWPTTTEHTWTISLNQTAGVEYRHHVIGIEVVSSICRRASDAGENNDHNYTTLEQPLAMIDTQEYSYL